MNALSAAKCREMDSGLLGEKSFEIVVSTPRDAKVRTALEMYHLTLNKQASYLGQRNLKYFDGSVSVLANGNLSPAWSRRLTARVTPYSPQTSEVIVSQKHKNEAEQRSAEMSVSVSTTKESEMRKTNRTHVSFSLKLKQPLFRNQLTLFSDESMQRYGFNYCLSFSNRSKGDYIDDVENSGADGEQMLQSKKNKKSKPLLFGISINLKQIRFDRLPQCNVYADLMLQKFEGVLSANINGKKIESIMGLFRYNSSLWMRITSATSSGSGVGAVADDTGAVNGGATAVNGGGLKAGNGNGNGGIEVVYKHTFNEFVTLKNYINSSYTIATHLSYAPTDFLTLIYSAQVNIQKFKQDIEDYKVGYGIHINL